MFNLDRKTALNVISTNVSSLMDEKAIGVRELARSSEVDPMVVSRLVNGTNLPGIDAIYRIAAALEVTVDALLAPEKSQENSSKDKKSSKKSA